jgi:hypothetical protein
MDVPPSSLKLDDILDIYITWKRKPLKKGTIHTRPEHITECCRHMYIFEKNLVQLYPDEIIAHLCGRTAQNNILTEVPAFL